VTVERLIAQQVWKSYGPTVVLRGASASFERGELATLTGANGAGKTTLLGILGGMIRPQRGTVVAEGLEGDRRRCLGWASHETLMYGDLSGEANVRLAARAHGAGDEAWDVARERFDLGAFAGRPVRTYSRGQRQRVALARALVHQPEILLLDEPTTGLDPRGVGRLEEVLGEEKARGTIVVVVTHDLGAFAGLRPVRWDVAGGKVKKAGDVSRET
jgi:ABC-type multidrug transport system ATPase subunit